MYKILRSDKDTYVTDKVVRQARVTGSNVGAAGTLDLFKLYGASMSGSTPNTEVSRLLIHFDLDPLRTAMSQGRLDPGDPSFWCKMHLYDVYGGQPTPANFEVSVFPLSASFDEGLGRDVTYYSDSHIANWLSSSTGTAWYVTGCSLAAGGTGPGDYITSSLSLVSTEKNQTFKTGEEDLLVDVTSLVSATLSGEIPDSGFRISFKNSLEVNTRSYFVKRFASRNAFDESKHPRLIVGFDDSVTDDTQNLTFDAPCRLSLYNIAGGNLTNILSGSSLSPVTGSNCLILKLVTEVSGGNYDVFFTGSQSTLGTHLQTGSYFAPVTLQSSDPTFSVKLQQSSSIKFTPVWTSLDGTVTYVSGSSIHAYPPTRTTTRMPKNYVVSVTGLQDTYDTTSSPRARVHIFDQTSPLIKVVRLPVELPGVVVKNVFYQVRDITTGEAIFPFDDERNSTKVSSDSEGMFFTFDAESLTAGRTYVVDIMISHDGLKSKYMNASPVFRIERSSDQT